MFYFQRARAEPRQTKQKMNSRVQELDVVVSDEPPAAAAVRNKNQKKRAQQRLRAKAKATGAAGSSPPPPPSPPSPPPRARREHRRREICSVKGCYGDKVADAARLQLCAGCRVIKYCSATKQREDWAWHGWWCRRFPACGTRKAERRFLQDIDAAVNAPPSPAPGDALCGCAGAIDWTLETLREMRATLRGGGVAVVADGDGDAAAARPLLSPCGTAYIFNVVLETHRRLPSSLVGLVQLTFVRPPPTAHPSTLPRLDRAELRMEARGSPATVAAFDKLVEDLFFQNITACFGRATK